MAAADDQPAPEPPPPAPTGKRAQRLAEDRMRRPGENTAHERGEDR